MRELDKKTLTCYVRYFQTAMTKLQCLGCNMSDETTQRWKEMRSVKVRVEAACGGEGFWVATWAYFLA